MPEWVTPKLYWVVGTKDALSSFPAAAKPFADTGLEGSSQPVLLTDAKLAENCPPNEPSEEFWTSSVPKWEQVPRKARHLLAKLDQYVMLLDYGEHASATPVGAEPPELDPPSAQVQHSGALPSARGSAWGAFKQLPLPVHHFTSRPKCWCGPARKLVMRSTLHACLYVYLE